VADWRALLCFGTVLDEGEELTSPRAVDAAGPGAVVLYHAMYERGGAAAVDGLPGGRITAEGNPPVQLDFALKGGELPGSTATAARVINAIPAVCAANPGVLGALDIVVAAQAALT
jgi:5,10-methylenetetrahydromethanopterin reductase